MASVFKRSRWVDASGKQCKRTDPGARKVKSRYWTIAYAAPGTAKVKRVRGFTDKSASEQRGAELERLKARGEMHLFDQYAPHRRRGVEEHVKDYVANLRAIGRDEKYVQVVEYRLAKLREACGWNTLTDITADSFSCWRNAIPRREKDGKPEIGPATQNQYLEAARAFLNWCVSPAKRIPSNPLAEVEKVDETADVRRARRPLSEQQVAAFLNVVAPAHKSVYRFLLTTGLRRQEVEDLTWGNVRLNAPRPFLSLTAGNTKSKRADTIPLRVDLADELRKARGDAQDGDKVFAGVPTMDEHRAYLIAAGIDWEDEAGRRVDVHAMRHTFGTMLSTSGVQPREAMELMRHTDMRLTMKVYTDPKLFNLAGAVEKLPLPASDAPAQAQATGTDGAAVETPPMQAKQSGTKSGTTESALTGPELSAIGRGDETPEQAKTPHSGGVRHQSAGTDMQMMKAPQDVLVQHRPFIETGAWKARYLHQIRRLDVHPWKALKDLPETHDHRPGVKACPMERAKHLQSFLDSGQVKNRSELATRLGVSRARISQILGRLKPSSRQVGA